MVVEAEAESVDEAQAEAQAESQADAVVADMFVLCVLVVLCCFSGLTEYLLLLELSQRVFWTFNVNSVVECAVI